MKSLNIKTYLLYAIYIVRTHPRILLVVAAIGLINELGFLMPESGLASMTGALTVVFTIFVSPLIYGIYFEAIEQRKTPIPEVFRTYVPGYLLLLLCLYVPIVLTTAMYISLSGQGADPTPRVLLIILVFSLLFLYVIPAYYILRSIQGAIVTGMRFLAQRLLDSAPVLLIALMSELLLLITNYQLGWLRDSSPLIFAVIDYSAYMVASVIDFILFVILVYVLKDNGIVRK